MLWVDPTTQFSLPLGEVNGKGRRATTAAPSPTASTPSGAGVDKDALVCCIHSRVVGMAHLDFRGREWQSGLSDGPCPRSIRCPQDKSVYDRKENRWCRGINCYIVGADQKRKGTIEWAARIVDVSEAWV